MASPSGQGASGIISGINVTPLVDVMLVLLAIFMVTAKLVAMPAVPLELPRAAHAEAVEVVLSVTLPAHGPSLVNGAALANDEALEARVRSALAGDAQLRVVIEADGRLPHGRVIQVLDRLRGAGVTRVAFGALPMAGPAP
jgi:biopolymer transport protein ExbD